MSLDDYLRRFSARDCRRVTLVGPMPLPAGADELDEPLVWVDGGVNHRHHHRHRRHRHGQAGFAVGDGDSARAPLDQYLRADKDYSDLGYVLARLPRGVAELTLLGFLGGRRDHELFNLGEVHRFLAAATTPARARFGLDFDAPVAAYSKGRWRFDADGLFSLAALAPTVVTLLGACQYPLPMPTPIAPLVSLALSNRGFGEIILTTEGPAFILKPG